jgi:hypothetical protein
MDGAQRAGDLLCDWSKARGMRRKPMGRATQPEVV